MCACLDASGFLPTPIFFQPLSLNRFSSFGRLLRDWYYKWFKEADKSFDTKLDEYYIASTITREPAPTSASYNWLCDFLRKYKLKHLGCHGLWHTYYSLLLSQNVPIQTVSKYMGHSDSTVTLKVYSHFIPDTQDKVLGVLNNLY